MTNWASLVRFLYSDDVVMVQARLWLAATIVARLSRSSARICPSGHGEVMDSASLATVEGVRTRLHVRHAQRAGGMLVTRVSWSVVSTRPQSLQ